MKYNNRMETRMGQKKIVIRRNIIMKKLFAVMLAALMMLAVFAGCSAPASTEDTSLKDMQEKGYFILGLDDAFPPMGYRDENGEIVGFDIDLARAVAEEMGVELKIQPVIWDNIVQELNSGNVDCIWNGCTITDARKETMDFSDPYMDNMQVVVVLEDSPYQSLADLAGVQAGTQDGSASQEALDANPEFRDSLKGVTGYPTFDKALLDLVNGRTECVIIDVCVYGHYRQIQPDTYRVLDEDLGSEQFGIAFCQEDDALRGAIQEAFDAIVANGKAAEISQQWFGTDVIAK